MTTFFGLHVGRTSACVAVSKDGKTEVVANDAGDRVTPAVVKFSSSEISVGLPAKQGLFRNTSSTAINCKELLGSDKKDDSLKKVSVCPLAFKKDAVFYEVEIDEKTRLVSPEEVLQHIYGKLNEIAVHHTQTTGDQMKAVLSVPLNFNGELRKLVWRAAEKAGFHVVQVISEPAAALLAYGIGQTSKHDSLTCLVYRCGGTTLDVSVVDVRGGMYGVKCSLHRKMGGDKFTELISNFLADEFQNKWKLDPRESKRSMSKLWSAAEHCKHCLSTLNTAHCFVESLHEGVDLSANVSRARIDMLITQMLPAYLEPVRECLDQTRLTSKDIDKVIVCGGVSKMPRLQQALKELLPDSEVLSSLTADEVMALGCCHQAALMADPWDATCQNAQVPVTTISKSIAIRCGAEGETLSVFSAETPLSSRHTVPIPLGKEHHSATIDVVEGEERRLLAKLTLDKLPEAPSVAATFHLASDGSLHVALTEKMTGITTTATIGAATA